MILFEKMFVAVGYIDTSLFNISRLKDDYFRIHGEITN